MENIKCLKPGCNSKSFRTISGSGNAITLKCNICGTVFKTDKAKIAGNNFSSGRTIYGDRNTYDEKSTSRSFISEDDSPISSPSYSPNDSFGNDSFGGGSSDGGGGSNDW